MTYFSIMSSALVSISSNVDNIFVGVSYGIRGVRIPFYSNILIATITGAGTMASMVFGRRIGEFIGAGYASIISGALFIVLGGVAFSQKNDVIFCKKIVDCICSINFVKKIQFFEIFSDVISDPLLADNDNSGHIDIFESIILSVTLVINNIANGAAAGMAGLGVFVTTLFVILLSIVAIWMGVGAGVRFRTFWFRKNTAKISGVILVCMGLLEIFS